MQEEAQIQEPLVGQEKAQTCCQKFGKFPSATRLFLYMAGISAATALAYVISCQMGVWALGDNINSQAPTPETREDYEANICHYNGGLGACFGFFGSIAASSVAEYFAARQQQSSPSV